MIRLIPRPIVALLIALGVALGTAPSTKPVRAVAAPLVVIVNPKVPLKDISSGLLRSAFLGEIAEYAPGKRFIPFNHVPAAPARMAIDRALLGLQPSEVGRFWVDRRIRDQPPPPRTIPSQELALRVVASLPGTISYVYQNLVNASVRVITIDGKASGQPGYLLQ
jgi:hypothetical protein